MDIQIQNGDHGVSWAIKRQLKQDGVNVQNINSCWTAIMNAFKDDKESKVNNNIIGEKWTSLRANVECSVNHVIHIAETTWIKIKDIVSKAAENKQNASNDTPAAPNGSSERTSTQSQNSTVIRGGKTYKTDENGYSTTDCDGVFYKDGKHYRRNGEGQMEEIRPRTEGGRIIQFCKDGSWYEKYIEIDEKNYGCVKFDKNGNVILDSHYENGKRIFYTACERDEKGKLIKETEYDENGKPVRTDKYQGVGELTEQEARFHQDGKTIRWQKRLITFSDSGDYVQWVDDQRESYHGYRRYNKRDEFMYNCDKNGNEIK